jgi:hypothetical protein
MPEMPSERKPAFDAFWAPVWGAEEIGKVINRTERQVFHLLHRGLLDADKVGSLWCSTPPIAETSKRLKRPRHCSRFTRKAAAEMRHYIPRQIAYIFVSPQIACGEALKARMVT